jgi:hypothetical protein
MFFLNFRPFAVGNDVADDVFDEQHAPKRILLDWRLLFKKPFHSISGAPVGRRFFRFNSITIHGNVAVAPH